MFTGIIEEVGQVLNITNNRIQIGCTKILNDIKVGDSVSVNGVCLTVCDFNDKYFIADVSYETYKVTNFKCLNSQSLVNLERAMLLNGRFGGHIVSGHVDGIAKCIYIKRVNEFYNLTIELPSECAKYVVKKGSITINGISLTVAEINDNKVSCAIIPQTYENTNLKTIKNNDFINIETDIIAKYIEKFLSTSDNESRIDYNFLNENGFI